MNKYQKAVAEVRSVLGEWSAHTREWEDVVANKIVERLVAQGLIQSTDPDELVAS